MYKYKRLYEIACRIGERHSLQVVAYANENRVLRQTIWRALKQLYAGRADLARQTLEQVKGKDDDQ